MKLKATWKQKDQAKWQVIGNMCRQRHATEVKDKMLQQLRDGELRAGKRPWNFYQKKNMWRRERDAVSCKEVGEWIEAENRIQSICWTR